MSNIDAEEYRNRMEELKGNVERARRRVADGHESLFECSLELTEYIDAKYDLLSEQIMMILKLFDKHIDDHLKE